jgi:mannose-6-phosphate isomerase-like protein (cupin superfamily)
MHGFIEDIETLTEENEEFRKVIYTGEHLQLVLMAIPVDGEIGEEVHEENDQFFRVEEGEGEVVIDGVSHLVAPGAGVVVPAGASHNIRNRGSDWLKVYTLYGPPHHKDGIVHDTRDEAEADDEEFDGETTEN